MKAIRRALLVFGSLCLVLLVLPPLLPGRHEVVFLVNALLAVGAGIAAYQYAKQLGRSGILWGIFSFLLPFIVPLVLAFLKRPGATVRSYEPPSHGPEGRVGHQVAVASPTFLDRDKTPKEVSIPEITAQHLSIALVDSSKIGAPGPGGGSFQQAIQAMNSQDYNGAANQFRQALDAGLDPLRQGYAHANLGTILTKKGDLAGAVGEFIRVLEANEALYESVHDAAQYLGVVMQELGRQEQAHGLQLLSARTAARLGSSLSPAAAEEVRCLVRRTPIVKPVRPEEEAEKNDIAVLKNLCLAYAADNQAEISKLEPLARQIGTSLDARGGLAEMRRVFAEVEAMRGARTLEMHWNGIGDWRG